jgi:hypothetical protein
MRNFQFWVLGLLIFICIHICGCFFLRLDIEHANNLKQEKTRISGTIWTIGKNYNYVDPNTWFSSEADKLGLWTPYGRLETE